MWGNCSLVKTGRTSEAEMLHARDMVQIEDVSDGALPQTTDDDNATVQGAQKYQQAHCLVRFRIGFPKEFGRFSVFHGVLGFQLEILTVFLPALWQIGNSAAGKILDSVLDGLSVDSNAALFLIDVNPGVGNIFDAYVQKRSTVNFNFQYVAMMPDALSAEWFRETKAGPCRVFGPPPISC